MHFVIWSQVFAILLWYLGLLEFSGIMVRVSIKIKIRVRMPVPQYK